MVARGQAVVNLFIGITDDDWFEDLRGRTGLAEVNFWQPGGRTGFQALVPGELFLFKLHAPHNVIVGGGFFSHSTFLPVSLAWEVFREANGAASASEMKARISKYRRQAADAREDYQIGCRILEAPFFWEEADWLALPDSFSRWVQQGKRYSTDTEEGRRLYDEVQARLQSVPTVRGLVEDAARYGEPTLVLPRIGQGAFRIRVTDAYQRRCAVTGERTLPVLQAAHIKPYSEGGTHDLSNGLLLRSDIHTLFDLGYVTVSKAFRFEVSKRIRENFENGRDYYRLHGREIARPGRTSDCPEASVLEWHNEHRFLG